GRKLALPRQCHTLTGNVYQTRLLAGRGHDLWRRRRPWFRFILPVEIPVRFLFNFWRRRRPWFRFIHRRGAAGDLGEGGARGAGPVDGRIGCGDLDERSAVAAVERDDLLLPERRLLGDRRQGPAGITVGHLAGVGGLAAQDGAAGAAE